YIYRGLDENKIGDSRNPYPTHLGTSPRYHRK
ncbi:MAG: serine protease, partial [Thermobifida sp.]|nr:serine protease [Thermobifida sp.]